MASRRTRIVDSSVAGYAPGQFQPQYYDPEMALWFDIGSPKESRPAAEAALLGTVDLPEGLREALARSVGVAGLCRPLRVQCAPLWLMLACREPDLCELVEEDGTRMALGLSPDLVVLAAALEYVLDLNGGPELEPSALHDPAELNQQDFLDSVEDIPHAQEAWIDDTGSSL